MQSGRRIPARVVDVKRLENALGHIRVAVIVPKYGFTSVRRNKLKRQLRELARLHVLPRAASCDVLVRARRDTYQATFDQLRSELGAVAEQLP